MTTTAENGSASGLESPSQALAELRAVHDDLLAFEAEHQSTFGRLDDSYRDSARNLLHYLALRRHDMRHLQASLARMGLSSLGRAEAHVLDNLEAVLTVLRQLTGEPPAPLPQTHTTDHVAARRILERRSELLLGAAPRGRTVRIMVTVPTEAASNYALVRDLLNQGMDCMRINCAHDDAGCWARMIANLQRARLELGRECRVLMDLAGPKLRTGAISPGPQVVKWRPRRDVLGRVTVPTRLWLTPSEAREVPPQAADAVIPVPGDWLAQVQVEDVVAFRDARGKSRKLKVVDVEGASRWANADETAYLTSGTPLDWRPAKGRCSAPGAPLPCVGELPCAEQYVLLSEGDTLVLTSGPQPGSPARFDLHGQLLAPATIPCTLPEVFSCVSVGERILFDDGKIGGIIRSVSEQRIEVEITRSRPKGLKLMADKGINLPDSDLDIEALTTKDIQDLEFVAANADVVGYSFVRTPEDIDELVNRLAPCEKRPLGIMLKIETQAAFEQLPLLLLAAMRRPAVGVMIARGDLAVECGFERLAEVQEEILWLCEAAHIPVVWATQVLESLAKFGMPSRAEITDAAMGVRAECVMLNKGPYIVETLQALVDILQRMEGHQSKKTAMLRPLGVARSFLNLSQDRQPAV